MRIAVRRVTAGYRGTVVLRGVELEVGAGGLLSLIGPNGAGKTTLLRVIAGVIRPYSGEVYLDGVPLSRLDPREVARRVGVVPQVPELHADFTVRELVELGRLPHLELPDRLGRKDRAAVARALESMGLSGVSERRLSTLSGGEQRRAFIAAALARGPGALLLDEPTAHLDIRAQLELIALLRERVGEGITVLATFHDLNLAATFPRMALLAGGAIRAIGPPGEVLVPELVEEAYGIRLEVFRDPETGGVYVYPPRGLAPEAEPPSAAPTDRPARSGQPARKPPST